MSRNKLVRGGRGQTEVCRERDGQQEQDGGPPGEDWTWGCLRQGMQSGWGRGPHSSEPCFQKDPGAHPTGKKVEVPRGRHPAGSLPPTSDPRSAPLLAPGVGGTALIVRVAACLCPWGLLWEQPALDLSFNVQPLFRGHRAVSPFCIQHQFGCIKYKK